MSSFKVVVYIFYFIFIYESATLEWQPFPEKIVFGAKFYYMLLYLIKAYDFLKKMAVFGSASD